MLNTHESKKLCLDFLNARSEKQVIEIIHKSPAMQDAKNWRWLGDTDANFNRVGNQQSTGGKAATELITNGVDALLNWAVKKSGIDPTDKINAPKTTLEAVKFVENVTGHKIIDASLSDRTSFAEKYFCIAVDKNSVDRKGECFTFAEAGEGQHGKDFPKTFMSLDGKYKSTIPYLQGKFSMGSWGSTIFSGREWFKLIISCHWQNPGTWSWTLARKKPTDTRENPAVEYFCLDRKDVPNFQADSIMPFKNQFGETLVHENGNPISFEQGTIVKLYDYNFGKKSGYSDQYHIFDESLTDTNLPIRIFIHESKKMPEKGHFRKQAFNAYTIRGMERFIADQSDIEKVPSIEVSTKMLGKIEIRPYFFKDKIPEWIQGKNTHNTVFHSVNGQVMQKDSRQFVSQQCDLPGLKEHIVLIIDDSNVTTNAHVNLFKGDRETMRKDTDEGREYFNEIKQAVKNSKELKVLQDRVIKEELEKGSQTIDRDAFEKLVNDIPDLAKVLGGENPDFIFPDANSELLEDGPGDTEGPTEADVEEDFEGVETPTYLDLVGDYDEIVDVPINRSKTIIAKTNAANDFFDREKNRGQFYFNNPIIKDNFAVKRELHNGKLKITLKPDQSSGLQVGDCFEFRILLEDFNNVVRTGLIKLRITEKATNISGGRKPPKDEGNENANKIKQPGVPIPDIRWMTKDGRDLWDGKPTKILDNPDDLEFGGVIKDMGAVLTVYVNNDNVHLLNARKSLNDRQKIASLDEKYKLAMAISMVAYHHKFKRMAAESGNEKLAETIDDVMDIHARSAASTTLILVNQIAKAIENQSKNSD